MKTPMYINRGFVPLSDTDAFGCDKLHLFTDEFEVRSPIPWDVKPRTKKAGEAEAVQPLLFNAKGHPVHGEKAFTNQPDFFTAEIRQLNGRPLLMVQCNPSRLYHDYHLTADGERIADGLKSIQTALKEQLQTDVDLMSAKISRVDIAAQAAMTNPVPHYDTVIRGSRTLKRSPKTEYPNGFLMGNKQRELCTYDKGLKLMRDSGPTDTQSTNLLRVEPRVLNAAAVKEHCSFATAEQLCSADLHLWKWTYSKTVNGLLKIQQAEIPFIEVTALSELIKIARETYPRQWLLFLIGILSNNGQNLPDVNQFKAALCLAGVANRTMYRTANDYQKQVNQMRLMQASYLQTAADNYADNHKEFTDKFISKYA